MQTFDPEVLGKPYEFAHEFISAQIKIDGLDFYHTFRRPGKKDEQDKEHSLRRITVATDTGNDEVKTINQTRATGGMLAYYNTLARKVRGYDFGDGKDAMDERDVHEQIEVADEEGKIPLIRLIKNEDKIKAARQIYNGAFRVLTSRTVKRTRSVRSSRLTPILWVVEEVKSEEEIEKEKLEKAAGKKEIGFDEFEKREEEKPGDDDDKDAIVLKADGKSKIIFWYGEPDTKHLKLFEKITSFSSYEYEGGERTEFYVDLDVIAELGPSLIHDITNAEVNGEPFDRSNPEHLAAVPLSLWKTTLILFYSDYRKHLGN